MSVVDTEKIDSMGIKLGDSTCLCLLISDHVDWDDEYFHLLLLQEKINAYLDFITEEQYHDQFPNNKFQSFEIVIYFTEEIPENCFKFLLAVESKLKSMNLCITFKPIHQQ